MATATPLTSDEDEADLMALFKKGPKIPPREKKARSQTATRDSSERKAQVSQKLAGVEVPPVQNRSEYIYYDGKNAVQRIRREFEKRGELFYDVELVDGTYKQVSKLCHGSTAKVLATFTTLASFTALKFCSGLLLRSSHPLFT